MRWAIFYNSKTGKLGYLPEREAYRLGKVTLFIVKGAEADVIREMENVEAALTKEEIREAVA